MLLNEDQEVKEKVNGVVQDVNGAGHDLNGTEHYINGVVEDVAGASHLKLSEEPAEEQTKPNLQQSYRNAAREKPVRNRKFTLLWPKPKVILYKAYPENYLNIFIGTYFFHMIYSYKKSKFSILFSS